MFVIILKHDSCNLFETELTALMIQMKFQCYNKFRSHYHCRVLLQLVAASQLQCGERVHAYLLQSGTHHKFNACLRNELLCKQTTTIHKRHVLHTTIQRPFQTCMCTDSEM